jgi:SAM-dependent methyltransferase
VSDQNYLVEHYSQTTFDFEVKRLPELSPVEFAMTKRMLDRWIPDGAHVAEIGVGAGHYSEHLANRGCRIHLVDIVQRLLDTSVERLQQAGMGSRITGVSRLSATDLHALDDGAFDAVLLLGPLYHLRDLPERRRAVTESARLLKPAGLLYAAGINRLPYFRELFRETPDQAVPRREFHKRFLEDGNVDPQHAPPLGFGHLSTAEEFREQFAVGFEPLILMGVESFLSAWQTGMHALAADQQKAWLDLVEQTGVTPDGLGQADHFLFVGRKT